MFLNYILREGLGKYVIAYIDNILIYSPKIIKSRRRSKTIEYLVDWKGYGPEEQCWVKAKDILDPFIKQAFHTENPNQPAPCPRGRPSVDHCLSDFVFAY